MVVSRSVVMAPLLYSLVITDVSSMFHRLVRFAIAGALARAEQASSPAVPRPPPPPRLSQQEGAQAQAAVELAPHRLRRSEVTKGELPTEFYVGD